METILFKTPLGVQEVKSRALKLPPKLRTMLILVDGRLSAAELKAQAQVVGAQEDFLEVLLRANLIAAAPVELPAAHDLAFAV